MLLSYNTINGTEVYEIDPVVRIKTFVNMCDGYEYIRRALDPVIHMVHWFKLEANVLRIIYRRRVVK